MKTIFVAILFSFLSGATFAQSILSGEYDFGLKLAFDSKTKMLTGYFENYTGWDEETKNPKFSCIFYIEGVVANNKFDVLTYYPEDKSDDTITGQVEIIDGSSIKIKLPNEHGGCWNVQHFADEPVLFEIEKKTNWVQINYVVSDKAHFFSEKSEGAKQKAYLVKNDIVYVDKLEGAWAYCTYQGKQTAKGWIKITDLNRV